MSARLKVLVLGGVGEQRKFIEVLVGSMPARGVGLCNDRNDASAFAWLIGLEILEVLFQIVGV